MKILAKLVGLQMLILFVASMELSVSVSLGQTPSTAGENILPFKSAPADDVRFQEIQKSSQQLREQLHRTEVAIANSRIAAESAARAQAAVLTERLESLKKQMEMDRDRQRSEQERAAAERDRQLAETQRVINAIIWGLFIFAAIGLLAIILVPLFQWRAVARLAQVVAHPQTIEQPQLGQGANGLLTPGRADASSSAADHAVSDSNRRLQSTIERMEQRILELEQSTAEPSIEIAELPSEEESGTTTAPASRSRPSGITPATDPLDEDPWVIVLVRKGKALEKAQKPIEALGCYDEILRLEPENTQALVRRGSVLEQLRQEEEALECYERALQIDPKMTLAYLHKGAVCNRLERYEEALVCYQQAMRVEEDERRVAAFAP
jgi:tetratricopeptide (TPR) repeat protein